MSTLKTYTCVTLLFYCLGTNAPQAAEFCDDAYAISITLPNQARWDMCWEHRYLNGISLHHIHYTPRNGGRRMILNRAELSQVHVPYDDNGARYHDITDFGFGGEYLMALRDEECTDGTLLDYVEKPVICQQILGRGEALRLADKGMQGNTLSLFSVSQIGAYNYIPRWQFMDDGSMELAVGATGALQRMGDTNAAPPGWLIAENTIGISHLHNFFWRLDFDLGGQSNTDYVEELDFIQENGQLVQKTKRFTQEAATSVNPETSRTWQIASSNMKNKQGKPMGYEIQLNQTNQRDTGPDDEPFTHYDLYVTKENGCELYASHNSSANEDPCADNLAEFANNESITGQDIIVWPSLSFYHVPRAEDAPNMDIHWSSLRIIPYNWHNKNPLQ